MTLQTEKRKQPEISVIVPVYNVAPYLAACLDSILAQTFRDFELILVEDGSTDGSREIAEEYEAKDARVRLVEHRWNHGTSAARNLAMELSRGKYVAFVDSDDILSPEYLSYFYQAAEQTGTDVAQAGFHEFSRTPGDGDVVRWTEQPGFIPAKLQVRMNFFLPLRVHIAPWSKLFRKDFLDRHHLAFPTTPVANDVCFHYQCLLTAERYLVLPPGDLYNYRVERAGSLQSVEGLRRAERYAVSMARSLEAFMAWAQQEEALSAEETRQELCYLLYLFYLDNFRNIATECGDADAVSAHCKAALAEEPQQVLGVMRKIHQERRQAPAPALQVAVAGTGYVGIVTAACLAEHGCSVTCVDVDPQKINQLAREGTSSIYEKDLDALLQKNRARLAYTTDAGAAYRAADIIFICVGTPENRDGSADLRYVFAAARQVAETAQNECVLVVKSTVPIGTNERVEKLIRKHRAAGAPSIHVASNPEFLSQGTAVHDTLHASRIVIGVEDDFAREKLLTLYRDFPVPKLITNRRSAEMIKYASNDFLALKISYINEIANLCEEVGADVEAVAKGMGYDERIGSRFLKAGIGYGGSCFPKDTKALHWFSSYHEHEMKTVKAAIEVNDHQKLRLLRKAQKYYEELEGLTVAVLGLTFKPGTDDLREAPSLANVPLLLEEGAVVKVYDPVGMERFHAYFPTQVQYCDTIDMALQDADLCLIMTDWPQIQSYDPVGFRTHMKHAIVLDGRNCYALEDMKRAGITYESIGRQ